ncbi:MAG TPA: alpha-glucan family phosphorylase [Solirubrobacteraceae bacterium]|nr:alpha-glucan family phosphorylase [Solirubrobacteraceae bacterium]
MGPGEADLDRAAAALAWRLPDRLAPLARLAYNYRWCWLPGGSDLFRSIDPRRWRLCGGNPVRLLQEASTEALMSAADDSALLGTAAALEQMVRDDLAREPSGPVTPDRPVAFFCAEYAVHQSLPIYSGGLGALAGDILKEASDRALPLVAVGLMYRRGYFRQRIDATGWQQEYWVLTDPERLPAALVTGDDGLPLKVTVPIGDTMATAQIWRVQVGRVPLFLLDSELPENDELVRWTTSRLYDADPDTRLAQYALLGLGGVAALQALEIDPGVVHLNEGHAAFASLAQAQSALNGGGRSFDDALESVRQRTIFTTHTPVPAGNDTYPPDQVAATLRPYLDSLGIDADAVVRRGRTHPDDPGEPFGVTQFALRTSRGANGVSRRHGVVAREMWQGLWPGRPVDDVPITHVTNGVHIPSWVGAPMRALLDRYLGADWARRADDPETWRALEQVPDEELWAVRGEQRRRLVDFVRERSVVDRLARGDARQYVRSAAQAFDPEVLTVGFARRVATYKRLNLLFHDPERALGLLAGDRPVQFLIAGKAHPRDDEGKRLVQQMFALRGRPGVGERVVFLEDYDLGTAARLVRGCDVWVNVPRPPLEASGTSGMKSVLNGGVQLSVLDGWWDEGYDGANGWALSGEVDGDHGAQDHRHASELYRLLEDEVVPTFYDRDDAGLPREWIARLRASLITCGPAFSASRMLADYERKLYVTPA